MIKHDQVISNWLDSKTVQINSIIFDWKENKQQTETVKLKDVISSFSTGSVWADFVLDSSVNVPIGAFSRSMSRLGYKRVSLRIDENKVGKAYRYVGLVETVCSHCGGSGLEQRVL